MRPPPGFQQVAPITAPFPARDGDASGRTLSAAELGQLVRATAGDRATWLPVARFTPQRRWFHRLALTADYEIWLLTWLPGQHTGFHDHGSASGAFAVAHGELREALASLGRSRVRHRTAVAGSVTSFGGRHLHDVGNISAAPAVSVHAYSPPLSAMRRYEMTSSGLVLVRTERAELDW
ncbi:MAG TPA: cysteine dioxygenase family protein [Streptosporangiaceae bacterium]|jgi:predicted metal-dependent enzyme (double-stranded beta helix superfamily)